MYYCWGIINSLLAVRVKAYWHDNIQTAVFVFKLHVRAAENNVIYPIFTTPLVCLSLVEVTKKLKKIKRRTAEDKCMLWSWDDRGGSLYKDVQWWTEICWKLYSSVFANLKAQTTTKESRGEKINTPTCEFSVSSVWYLWLLTSRSISLHRWWPSSVNIQIKPEWSSPSVFSYFSLDESKPR